MTGHSNTTRGKNMMKKAALIAGALLLAGCASPPGSVQSAPAVSSPSPTAAKPSPSRTPSPSASEAEGADVELFYPTLISVAQSNGVSFGEAQEYQLVMAGHAACTTFGMGADLNMTAAALALEDYLPHEDLSDDALTLIAMAAAAMICPEHKAAAGLN